MTIRVFAGNMPNKLEIDFEGSSIELFKKLVARALNTWDQAPAELKELGDMLEHGRVTQDYQSQQGQRPLL